MERVSRGVQFIRTNDFLILGVLLGISLIIFGILTGTDLGMSTLGNGQGTASVIATGFSSDISRTLFGIVVGAFGLGYLLSIFKFKKARVFFSGGMTLSYLYILLLRVIVVGFSSYTAFFLVLVAASFIVYIHMNEEALL